MLSTLVVLLGTTVDELAPPVYAAYPTGGPVLGAFQKYNEYVPPGVWLPWIPQLISGLSRPEQDLCKSVLLRLVKAFPQVRAAMSSCTRLWLRTTGRALATPADEHLG